MPLIRSDLNPEDVLHVLYGLEEVYPGFHRWYLAKVVSGIRDGSRLILAETGDQGLSGVAILKRSSSELKLCTLWADQKISTRDTSVNLLERGLEWLGTRRPLFSVPNDILPRMRPLLARMDVSAPRQMPGIYRTGVTEHVFNGSLR